MNTTIHNKIQALRTKLTETATELTAKKAELKETKIKIEAENKRATKLERKSDAKVIKLWDALDKEQNKAHHEIWEVSEVLEDAYDKLERNVRALSSIKETLTGNIKDLQEHSKKTTRYCAHCGKLKPQAPEVCRCK